VFFLLIIVFCAYTALFSQCNIYCVDGVTDIIGYTPITVSLHLVDITDVSPLTMCTLLYGYIVCIVYIFVVI